MEALGSDAVQIPNGVDVDAFASAPTLEGYPRPGKSVLFLGRFDEPRKGMDVLLRALPALVDAFPDVEVLVGAAVTRRSFAMKPANWPDT